MGHNQKYESETSKKNEPVQAEQEEGVAPHKPSTLMIKKEDDAFAAPQVAEVDQIVESEPVQTTKLLFRELK